MKVTIDRAGRVVVPKSLRDELGFTPDTPLEIEVVNDHLELSSTLKSATIVEGPNGPIVAATGASISDEDVRMALEAARERR
jgi:AbrB family looped-hinge helix DNA binding protein